ARRERMCLVPGLPRAGPALVGPDIKIVFTPTICKQTCRSGRCYNSCEKGDTTTLYSQGGHNHDPKSGFRICEYPRPSASSCLNRPYGLGAGGRGAMASICVQKTLPFPMRGYPPPSLGADLTLSSLNPSLVNVHINHPPEATVQIHQVARVRGDSGQSEENSVEAVLVSQLPASPRYSFSNGNSNSITTESGQQQRPQELMGRCFRETLHGQCANPLPGLAKFEDCCGSVGLFWGVNRCIPCPPRPGNGQVECPQGYKRLNRSHCQDINECLMLGLCKDAECVNTRGSFRCTCKPGTMLDLSRSRCVSDKAVSMEQGLCYRSVAGGVCALPLTQSITKQICCCSRVGKGWGKNCEKCPMLGSGECCPAVPGVVSLELVSIRTAHTELALKPPWLCQPCPLLPVVCYRAALAPVQARQSWFAVLALHGLSLIPSAGAVAKGSQPPALTQPSLKQVETLSNVGPGAPGSHVCPARHRPVCIGTLLCAGGVGSRGLRARPVCPSEIDRCASAPGTCGPGTCVNLPGRYSCVCGPGYRLHPSLPQCIGMSCVRDPCAGRGHCINSVGSYSCLCYPGSAQLTDGTCPWVLTDLNECEQPSVCRGGRCTNTPGSYRCECAEGYVMGRRGQCEDIDECADPSACPQGRCVNSQGSYECLSCAAGYQPRNGRCVDINECVTRSACPTGLCINTEGSFFCVPCEAGYTVLFVRSPDIDECSSPNACPLGICTNTEGSFACRACDAGYVLSSNRLTCEGINEWCPCAWHLAEARSRLRPSRLSISISNFCDGNRQSRGDGDCCWYIDECKDPTVSCHGGECLNTPGSYACHCHPGFELLNGTVCRDMNECLSSEICGPNGECLNSHGSYFCICAPGFSNAAGGVSCQDIDECANETLCGSHAFCDNTDGSFRCLCDNGYENLPPDQDCVDVNECELMVAVCGTALCENVEGSFLCLCLSDHEEYDTETGECRPRAGDPDRPIAPRPTGSERKECYYHISDVQLCDSVLAKNTTKEECCCTNGAAWGDNCETHPCPVLGTVEYSEICPSGKGYIPVEGTLLFGQTSYTDADECEMFGSEICRNGHCVNTVPGYKCFCRSGYLYDSSQLKCVDQDECENEMSCVNGECLNTDGSFHCFCSLPLVLDVTRSRCINPLSISLTEDLDEHDIHLDICWQRVSNYICNQPLQGRQTTYTECCCRYGEAWSQDCALCPHRASGENAQPQEWWGDRRTASPRMCCPQADGPSASTGHFDSFEGLQAEECGILNGCDNGRCVRVREGYTCDCFDGFQLDMTHMACVDIDECEVSSPGPLCEGGTCENTEGSYRCSCLPGFVAQAEPHRCAPETARSQEAAQL
uniref:Latent-transforming growth factor beta-binding protein 2 n=1 Tax=Pelusios castaneus TaxID=367368 RepID=A0A8C8SQE6_9SAUR